jgi:predicted enzyme related to lactoylglutathione lyase
MAERTVYAHGTHCWIHLLTPDAAASQAFYGDLFGWTFTPLAEGGPVMAALEEHAAAVLIPNATRPPHWNCYVAVDSADDVAARVEALGGTLIEPPFDVHGGSGRMAHLRDPTGAELTLWQAADHPGSGIVNVPGALTWNDLNTTDPAAAEAFYAELFGWTFTKAAPDVDYWIIRNGERSAGGMSALNQPGVPSHWIPYFGSEDVAAGQARVEELGGRTIFGPMDVPNGGSFVALADPQGAAFALVAGDFDD